MNFDYFKNRKSIRRFSNREVSDEMLDEIFELASHAPNTGNMQLYSVVVNREGDTRKQLEACHFNQPASTGATVLVTVCADINGFSRWASLSDAKAGFNNLLGFLSSMTDAVILAQQIVTIAEMKGLGTCYLGTVTYNADKISKLLRLPSGVVPVACIALGWPEEGGVESERLLPSFWVHKEHYRDDSDAEIRKAYGVKDEFGPNQTFIKENGKETLAQVFCDVRYPRKMNEEVSAMLESFLKEKGF